MKQVVMGKRFCRFIPERLLVYLKAVAEPENGTNMLLGVRCHSIGEAVKVDAVLPEGFAMIADISLSC